MGGRGLEGGREGEGKRSEDKARGGGGGGGGGGRRRGRWVTCIGYSSQCVHRLVISGVTTGVTECRRLGCGLRMSGLPIPLARDAGQIVLRLLLYEGEGERVKHAGGLSEAVLCSPCDQLGHWSQGGTLI